MTASDVAGSVYLGLGVANLRLTRGGDVCRGVYRCWGCICRLGQEKRAVEVRLGILLFMVALLEVSCRDQTSLG
jgi:hypothetical protein